MANESRDVAKETSEHLPDCSKMKEIRDSLKEKLLNKKETGVDGLENSKSFQMVNLS